MGLRVPKLRCEDRTRPPHFFYHISDVAQRINRSPWDVHWDTQKRNTIPNGTTVMLCKRLAVGRDAIIWVAGPHRVDLARLTCNPSGANVRTSCENMSDNVLRGAISVPSSMYHTFHNTLVVGIVEMAAWMARIKNSKPERRSLLDPFGRPPIP